MRLIDSHCHLNYEGLVQRQTEVLENARNRGVSGFLNISTRQRDEGVLHDANTFIHWEKFFNFCLIDGEYFHCGRKDITLRIVSEAHAKQGQARVGLRWTT